MERDDHDALDLPMADQRHGPAEAGHYVAAVAAARIRAETADSE